MIKRRPGGLIMDHTKSKSRWSDLPCFDTLMTMAIANPEGFERWRQEEVEALIDSAPDRQQQRLRGLQFQIDAQRDIHKSPMGACIKISNMMHDSFAQLRHMLNQLSTQATPATIAEPAEESFEATILEFPAR